MDLVTYEAPLDNSFQKDKRELVNKGSLGRRRKPSRSNLKLILSPTSDPSDIVAIRSSQLNDSFSNETGTSQGHLNGSILSDQQEVVSFDESHVKHFPNSHLRSAKSSNHRTSVGNGRSSELLSETVSSIEQEAVAVDQYRTKYLSSNHQQSGKSGNHHITVVNGIASEHINVLDNQQKKNTTTDQFVARNSPVNQIRSIKSGNHHLKVVNGTSPENINETILRKQQVSTNSSSNYSRSAELNNHRITVENDITSDHISKSILSNKQEEITGDQFHVKNSSSNHVRNIKSGNPHLSVACNNYREVIASINQLQKVNGDNRRTSPNSNNHQITGRLTDHQDVVNGNHQVSFRTNNKTNLKYCPPISQTRNNQNLNYNNHQENTTNNHKIHNSNFYQSTGTTRAQKVSDSSSNQQILSIRNQQQTVASKNHQNVVTFSNRRQIVTSTPVQSKKQNGLTSQGGSKLYIESSLPRTSNQPNLVEEARQFSIEAKLRRKKSEVQGRSAVLIQTWERRTQSDPFGKSKTSSKNRFGDKENTDAAMPDSYICSKYKGSLQNGDGIERDDLATNVRDLTPDKVMLQRVPDNRPSRTQQPITSGKGVTVNGKSSGQEPEWVSLSKKLCAKFVEGHIEPNSTDSYLHEELGGVKEVPFTTPLPKTHPGDIHPSTREVPKKKIVTRMPDEDDTLNSNGPPWIHLSRKLCNKFIEEHIEYPPITNGHFVEIVPELVEPNGDVRIIEKIGKPKGSRSKQKKESVPEWVSLSKKLRAKFIESHIDDPDTISLDNQLNASDQDETSSESLSDTSQYIPEKRKHTLPDVNGKNFTIRHEIKNDMKFLENGNEFESKNSIFPEKEVCWEYQEMEFDQESNSGTFQEAEYYAEPLQEARIHRDFIPQDNFESFAQRETVSRINNNPQCFQTPECFNNDVMFAPHCGNDERSSENKVITVQIISHANKDVNSRTNKEFKTGNDSSRCAQRDTIHGSFFNLSTWEETHHRKGDAAELFNGKKESLSKDYRSKSMDNLYDSLDNSLIINDDSCTREERNSEYSTTSTSTEYSNNSTNNTKYSTASTNKANYSTTSINKANYSTNLKSNSEHPAISNNAKISTTSTNNAKCLTNLTNNAEYPTTSTNNAEYSTISANKAKCSTTSTNNAEYSATPTNNAKFKVEEPLLNENTELFFEEFETEPQNLDNKSAIEENIKCDSEESRSESETGRKSSSRSRCQEEDRNILSKTRNSESSSDDEVFDCTSRNKKYSPDSAIYGEISPQRSPVLEKKQQNSEKIKNEKSCKSEKNYKCNGMIPNSIYSGLAENKSPSLKYNQNEKTIQNSRKEPAKLGMSKWITISKSEQNVNKNEYSNIPSQYTQQTERKTSSTSSENPNDSKEIRLDKTHFDRRYIQEGQVSKQNISPNYVNERSKSNHVHDYNVEGMHSNIFEGPIKEFDLKHKCKSLCDISYNDDSFFEDSIRHHESVADISSVSHKTARSEIEFQHFEFETEIPLCAKLVSNQNRKKKAKSISSASSIAKNESPCPSESSHIYEDMFKETPSGPSDSEASSWRAIKDNSYYVNGRSSSMNDLDYSDSCSMSVKCDYASSSENSTLQSRHSSYASSSFYVNLRDYDSHMLEPSLKSKKGKAMSTENCSSISKSNPQTPESLRHLFTSPLSSIHSPPNRTSRLVTRMPSDPQSHYYSTAAATSSAFKHGFDVTPPKPKKAERSSSIKIKDIAHGIILTFKRFQNHSKNANVSPTHYVDVSHLAEMNGHGNPDAGKSKKNQDSKKHNQNKKHGTENGKTDTDSGFLSDVQRAKARRSSSDLTGLKPTADSLPQDKKKSKSAKKSSNRDKGKKGKIKVSEPRTIPTVSRKVQQLADGTLYLVTTVSGDTALPGVYSDSPDTSSELSTHRPVKQNGESNC